MKIKEVIAKIINILKQLFEYLKAFVIGKVQSVINWVKEKKAQIQAYSAQSEKNKKRVRTYSIIIIVVLCYFAFSVVRGTIRGALSKREAAKERIIPVYTYTAKRTNVTEQFKINGNVMAENSVNILPDIGGKLVRYTVQVGDNVVRGQTVAYIDPSRPGSIYNLSPVPAPLDGTISSLPIELGNTVTTTTSVGQLGDLTQLKIETYVPERFVEMIHIGKEASVTTIAFPNDVFKAQIYELAPTLDPKTRTLLVKLRVTEGQGKLLSGMFSELLINARTIENVITVPAEAIITRSGKKYVYIIDSEEGSTSSKGQIRKLKRKNKNADLSQIDPGYYSGKAHMVPVETGIQSGDELIITKGLNPGDRVVYSGQDLLSENSLARILVVPSEEEDPIISNQENTQEDSAKDVVIDSPSSVETVLSPEGSQTQITTETQPSESQAIETQQGTQANAPTEQKAQQENKKQPLGIWLANIRAKIKTVILELQKRAGLSPLEKKAITNPDIEATEIIIEEHPENAQTPQALPVEPEQEQENTQNIPAMPAAQQTQPEENAAKAAAIPEEKDVQENSLKQEKEADLAQEENKTKPEKVQQEPVSTEKKNTQKKTKEDKKSLQEEQSAAQEAQQQEQE